MAEFGKFPTTTGKGLNVDSGRSQLTNRSSDAAQGGAESDLNGMVLCRGLPVSEYDAGSNPALPHSL